MLWLPEGPNAWDKRSFLCQLLWIIKVTLSWIMAALYLLSDPALVISRTIAPDHIKLDSVDRDKDTALTQLLTASYPWKQDLVEMTQWSWTRVPSHTCVPSLIRVTCQGQSPCRARVSSMSRVSVSPRATRAGLLPHSRPPHSILSTSWLGHSLTSKLSPVSRDSRPTYWT